jgi:Cu-Zn family superoxide dismutase
MKTNRLLSWRISAFCSALAVLLTAASATAQKIDAYTKKTNPGDKVSPTVATATALVQPTKGSKVQGTVMFTQEEGGVRVAAAFTGLAPGKHGFHVHERGDCSADDASSAGGHFNPTHQPHGDREAAQRHTGDLGNLVAGQDGRAELNYFDAKLTLRGPNSLIGHAVIVHAGADDLKSQPAGNSGARLACGLIEEIHP